VTAERNAPLVESGDAAGLGSTIGRLAADPELQERLVEGTASLYLRLAGRVPPDAAV